MEGGRSGLLVATGFLFAEKRFKIRRRNSTLNFKEV
jgi:hypothetical protein